jgi:type I restriction enzyme, S subunit
LVQNGDLLIGMDGDFQITRWKHGEALLNQRVCRLQNFQGVLPSFVFHFIPPELTAIQNATNSGTVNHISSKQIGDILIPVPPIKVQQEIVAILDKFLELGAELESELEARKIQYSDFSRTTFDFTGSTKVTWVEISEVCSTFSGEFIKKTKQDDSFEYPVFNGGSSATGYYSDFNSPENSIAISARGSIGAVNWVPTKFWAGNSCHVVLATDPKLNNRFLYHYLKFHEPSLYALRAVGSIPALNLKPLLKFKVPLPPIEAQIQISQVLDKFEALIHDIAVGLPAEIVARRQQYKYYRNKLLSFNELEIA